MLSATGRIRTQLLEVLGDEEDESEQGEEGDRHRTAGRGEPQVGEQPHVEHRGGARPLDHREGDERRGRQPEAGQAATGQPPVGGGFDHRVDEADQRDDRQAQAGQVHRSAVRHPGARHHQPGGDEGHGGHRCQREEDRTPPEVVEQQPADHRSAGDADPGHRAPGPDRARPGLAVLEGVGDHRQGGRVDQGGRRAHGEAHRDEFADPGAQRGKHAGHREQGQPGGQGLPPAVPVPDVAAGEHESGEREVVAVDDPLQGAGRRPQLSVQRGQGDVDDGGVQVDGERRQQDDPEDEEGARGP